MSREQIPTPAAPLMPQSQVTASKSMFLAKHRNVIIQGFKMSLEYWIALMIPLFVAIAEDSLLGPAIFLTPITVVLMPSHLSFGTLVESLALTLFGCTFAIALVFLIVYIIVQWNLAGYSPFIRDTAVILFLTGSGFVAGYIRAKYVRLRPLTVLSVLLIVQTLVKPLTMDQYHPLSIVSVYVAVLISAALAIVVSLIVFPISANEVLRQKIQVFLGVLHTNCVMMASPDTAPDSSDEARKASRAEFAKAITAVYETHRSAMLEPTYGRFRPSQLSSLLRTFREISIQLAATSVQWQGISSKALQYIEYAQATLIDDEYNTPIPDAPDQRMSGHTLLGALYDMVINISLLRTREAGGRRFYFPAFHRITLGMLRIRVFFSHDREAGRAGVRTALGLLIAMVCAFPTETSGWYVAYRAYWSVFTVMVVSNSYMNATILVGTYRLIGTITGAVWGALAYYSADGNPYVIMAFSIPLTIITSYVQLCTPRQYAGLIANVSFTLACLYPYISKYQPPYIPVWELCLQRTVAIFVGILIALGVHWSVFPTLARKKIRKGAAWILRNQVVLFGNMNDKLHMQTRNTHSQVTDLLNGSLLEPKFDGPFDATAYRELLRHMSTILDVICWFRCQNRANIPIPEYANSTIGEVCVTLQMLSFAIESKSKLPFYLPHLSARRHLLEQTLNLSQVTADDTPFVSILQLLLVQVESLTSTVASIFGREQINQAEEAESVPASVQ